MDSTSVHWLGRDRLDCFQRLFGPGIRRVSFLLLPSPFLQFLALDPPWAVLPIALLAVDKLRLVLGEGASLKNLLLPAFFEVTNAAITAARKEVVMLLDAHLVVWC